MSYLPVRGAAFAAAVFTLFPLAGAGLPANAQTKPAPAPAKKSMVKGDKDKAPAKSKGKAKKPSPIMMVGLTGAQKDKLKTIVASQRKDIKAMNADATLSKEQKKAKGKEIRAKYRKQMEAMLTDAQKAKLKTLRAARAAELKKERAKAGTKTASVKKPVAKK